MAVAKKYLAYFQGTIGQWEAADQQMLRHLVPENRRRVYNVRKIIETIADTGSFLEIRRDFGTAMVTGLLRLKGEAVRDYR